MFLSINPVTLQKDDQMLAVSVPVFDRYKSYSPYDMQESIRKEVKGDLEKSFLTLGNILHIIYLHSIIYTSVS